VVITIFIKVLVYMSLMLQELAFAAVFAALGVGSVTDFRTREVPDWVSYAALGFGLGFRLIYSLITGDWIALFSGFLGFLVGLGLGLLMYYTGQWGGGDSKILIGVGAIIGLAPDFSRIPLLILFIVNSLFFGSFYGLVYTLYLAAHHRHRFFPEFRKELEAKSRLRWAAFAATAGLLLSAVIARDQFVRIALAIFALVVLSMFYTWIFVRAVERSVMIKKVAVDKLTEGDWIVEDVVIDGKRICGPKDLGIELKQIAELKHLKELGKVDSITIKEGIPFVPGFFVAFVITLLLGDWMRFFSLF
jgi:Flp pilus assembly protein protease CpaA